MESILPLLGAALLLATPILLAALGETIAESAGVLVLSLEGTMLTAAFAGALGAHATGSAVVGVFCGIGAALLFATLFAWVVLWLRADEVIAGTAMNLLAAGVTAVFWRAAFGLGGAPPSVPHFDGGVTAGAALVLVPVCWLWLRGSGPGLRLRACGEAPEAAHAMGIPVRRTRFLAILACGALAGLGGVHLSLGDAHTFVDGMSAGRGFVAIALVIFGAHHPAGVAAAALLFGLAMKLQYQLQAADWQVPQELSRALPYVLSLAVLAGFAGKRRAPAALAKGLP